MQWSKGLLSFNSLMQCHDYYMDKVDSFTDSGVFDFKMLFNTCRFVVAKSYKRMAMYVENTFECSGMCKPSLFFYSLDLKHGRPMHTCGYKVIQAVEPYAIRIGVAILIMGLLLLAICKSTLIYWCRYKKADVYKKPE